MIPRTVLLACALAAAVVLARAQPAAPVSVPRCTHPGAGQTIYFLLTDRFANGNPANDRGGLEGGPDATGFDPARVSHFHGGDFAGLTAHLDYLRRLGVTGIWVTPPFTNKPMQRGSAGYHGYWITDFEHIDPHFGTDAEFRDFVRLAHARGLRVYLDIVVNHTADVIRYADGDTAYRDKAAFPYRDAAGRAFDDRAVAFNGLNDSAAFPALSAERSFPRVPVVPPAEAGVKHPAWLNDVTLYHNRGDSTFQGESSVYGDFGGLDDLFTEQPRVVQGFIAIFSGWLETGVDGFRIDTLKHVNPEFWQAFSPAIRARARALGRPGFLQFGEVYNEDGDPSVLSEYSTGSLPVDTTLDYGFFAAARRFVSQGGTAAALADFFARDDYYTDHDGNVQETTTFLSNHDAGRFAYFLQQDNPGAAPARLAALVRLGHGLLLLARGQPVLYYGDEQGMIGRGGGDMQAREDMFASQAPDFRDAPLLGTARTGADDKFDEQHPFYRLFARLAALRAGHAALRFGAMIPRATAEPAVFAFSRVERRELVEYLVVLNNSRTAALTATVPTSQPAGARLECLFDSSAPDAAGGPTLTADGAGAVRVTLPPLQFAVWRATARLGAASAPQIALVNPAAGAALRFSTRTLDGNVFSTRREIRAEVSGGDGVAEVTFALRRASRPGQLDLLGTDDTPPYRVFWEPPSDLAPGEELTFVATVSDLRGHTAAAEVAGVTVAPATFACGIRGARTPAIVDPAPATITVAARAPLALSVKAEGTGPLEYQWLHNGELVAGATADTYAVARADAAQAGEYRVLVHNLAGSAISLPTRVTVTDGR